MKLNEAVSKRLLELLDERKMTQYQLYMKSGVPKSTIGNVINCSYDSVKLRIIHEMCQGMGIGIDTFFASPLFQEVILSRLVDTFISRISLTMLPVPNPHNTVCVLSWEEARHWQSRSSGYSSS